MVSCEVEEVLKRISERAAERSIFNGETGKFHSLLSENFAKWFEIQRAESREKQIRELLADSKI